MIVLKRILNFYINSSIHVALAVLALTWITLIQFGLAYNESVLCFVFFATITGYNFVKYFGVAKFHHRSLTVGLKVIQVFSLIAFVAMCFFAFQLKMDTLILIVIFGGITFLYAIPLLPKRYFIDNHKNLREIGGLKIYIIALVWTFTTVVLPLIENKTALSTDFIITSVQRFLFVIVLMLPFEIRDLNYDSLKLATIPQKIGIKKTKIIGVLLLFVAIVLDFFKDKFVQCTMSSTLIISMVTLLLLVCCNKNQSQYYSAFWVESLPVFWLVVLVMLC
ncbi:MAG: hypothetical protein ACPGUH_06155 [Winogradskyella sp.]